MTKWIFFFLVFTLPLQGLFALDIDITERELGFNFRAEYNRTFQFCHDYTIFGGIELNSRHNIKTGFALGKLGAETEVKFFGSGHFASHAGMPLNFNLSYIYNGLPGFHMRSHNILSWLSYDWRRVGIAFGFNFRYTSFFV
jgi:hypothetical protein